MLFRSPKDIQIHTAKNGKEGIQVIIEANEEADIVVSNNPAIGIELYEMIDIPVEYNTASSTEQDGKFLVMEEQVEKPFYSTRKAPFRVYDCLRKVTDGKVPSKLGRVAFYMCFVPEEGVEVGKHKITLEIVAGDTKEQLEVEVNIYDVVIPEERFSVTNWFNLHNIASKYGLIHGTSEFYAMVRKYAQAMRRVRQTHFFLQLDPLHYLKDNTFDFSYIVPIVEIFFEEGFKTMEVGYFATKGDYVFTDELKCAADPSIKVSSREGYWIITEMVKAWQEFLLTHGWEEKVIYHICDEPDVHISGPESIVKRKAQYFMIASILRKYLNNPKIIEAVKTDEFKSGVDIWVPLTVNYEELKDEFDRLNEHGDEVWNYVCCAPTGEYLNRFLDIAVLRPRILFWGCSKYNLSGYLHWGFNYYGEGHNPFEQSCCPNDTGQGTSFPAGDSHIAYPGEDGPWISMRLEAQRKGIEDLELLAEIKRKDINTYRKWINQVFDNNKTYNDDVDQFESIREGILEYLQNERA